MMLRSIIILISLFAFVSCSEVLVPDIEEIDSFLVIEGSYSTKAGRHYVKVFHSKGYNSRGGFPGEEGAIVFVSDTLGNRIYYQEMGNGVYSADITESNVAKEGNMYYLEVVASDGNVYRSTPQLVVPSPEISNLYCTYGRRMILTEDYYGQPLEIEQDGIDIILETDGILESDNYYRYEFSAFEEHLTLLSPAPGSTWYMYEHRPLNRKYSGNIHTVNADEYGNFMVRNDRYLFIITDDMVNYTPEYPDTLDFVSTHFQGLLFTLRQYSLSPDAYRFYNDAEKQLEAEGHLFDPAYTQITGNIKCLTDNEKLVVGVFYTPDISIHHAYFYINLLDRTYSRELESLPELWLDTCSWRKPDSWISPPF